MVSIKIRVLDRAAYARRIVLTQFIICLKDIALLRIRPHAAITAIKLRIFEINKYAKISKF